MYSGRALLCERVGIGRQAGLRSQCRKAWEFKSPRSHHERVYSRYPDASRHPERSRGI